MTVVLNALTIAPKANEWICSTQQARVLHIFNTAINLINSQNQVISIVNQSLGNGPFSTTTKNFDYAQHIHVGNPVAITRPQIIIGSLAIDTSQADPWTPSPDWHAVQRQTVLSTLPTIKTILQNYSRQNSFAHLLFIDEHSLEMTDKIQTAAQQGIKILGQGLANNNEEALNQAVGRLAGLGIGLTPAGDDFLVGVMHALWAWLPLDAASSISAMLYNAAAPRTTSLSAAWLQAASAGETSEHWHTLINEIANQTTSTSHDTLNKILATGHTSGADALAGFVFTINQLRTEK